MEKTVLITGASGGIGEAFARTFARDRQQYRLVLVARNVNRLDALARELELRYSTSCIVVPLDLSKPTAAGKLYHQLEQQDIEVDILINNAGFGYYGKFIQMDSISLQQMMQLNMATLTQLTHLFSQRMALKGGGKILNVASVAGFQPIPNFAVYSATKAYVISLSEAVAEELAYANVTVTTLCPGPTKSNFFSNAKMDSSTFKGTKFMTSEEVALAGAKGLIKGERIVTPGVLNKLGSIGSKLLPRTTVLRITKSMMQRSRGQA
jgi:uncharacterized protein